MLERIRLLPILVIAAGLLFGLKVVDIVGKITVDSGVISSAQAVPGENEDTVDEPMVQAKQTGEVDSDELAGDGGKQPLARDAYFVDPDELTKSEIEVLQSLAGRRELLDQREMELDLRENLIKAAERRVEAKIKQLKKIEERIEVEMVERDSAHAEQIASLVKVYENMKPKVAAGIFEGLELDVMVEVMSRMKEPKMAKVMAAMNPRVARELTRELANRNKLSEIVGDVSGEAALTNPLSDDS